MPDSPAAWIVRVARNKAVDRMRRERVLADKRRALEASPSERRRLGARPARPGPARTFPTTVWP